MVWLIMAVVYMVVITDLRRSSPGGTAAARPAGEGRAQKSRPEVQCDGGVIVFLHMNASLP